MLLPTQTQFIAMHGRGSMFNVTTDSSVLKKATITCFIPVRMLSAPKEMELVAL
jgi:hypothetical protein